jgi:hypothetical protein
MIVILGAYFTTTSDAPSCGINNDRHSDDSEGVIYDHNILYYRLQQKFSRPAAVIGTPENC